MTVEDVRAFNRFYTGVIGLLDRGYLDSPYSLTEVRVLFEVANGTGEVAAVRASLGLDAGYLSRILSRFERDGLVVRGPSPDDARRQVVRLTAAGEATFADLDARSSAEIGALLARLPESDRRALTRSMRSVRDLLEGRGSDSYLLRPPRPGDLGWVVHRHGVRYAEECGFDATFEALVARVVADFGAGGEGEAAWIAEVAGEPVGSVFCVRGDDEATAVLRLLLVEPAARGLGIGKRLVDECLGFARRAGYRRIALWTVDELAAARHVYRRAGFELERSEPQRRFGRDVVGQTWSRPL